VFVLVNLKAYPCDPVAVARAARDVSDETDVRIAVAPQTAHLESVATTGVDTDSSRAVCGAMAVSYILWTLSMTPYAQLSLVFALLLL
jgi:triosephosphate isomerase